MNINTLIEEFKSFIYRLNNKGPKSEPWDTPDLIEINLDNKLDNLTNFYLLDRKLSNLENYKTF